VLEEKPEGKKPPGISSSIWEDNIKIGLTDTGFRVWTGCIWLKTVTVVGMMST
jgi:hypothetical protein